MFHRDASQMGASGRPVAYHLGLCQVYRTNVINSKKQPEIPDSAGSVAPNTGEGNKLRRLSN